MTPTTCRHPWQAAAHPHASSTNSTTTLLPFTIAALSIGVPLLALSTIIKPDAPFVLATVLLGLALPALFLTHRESGGAAVTDLVIGALNHQHLGRDGVDGVLPAPRRPTMGRGRGRPRDITLLHQPPHPPRTRRGE